MENEFRATIGCLIILVVTIIIGFLLTKGEE